MRAISLTQPWATLLFAPAPFRKRFETRSWYTSYRGKLAIHASGRASFDREHADATCLHYPFDKALNRMGYAVWGGAGQKTLASLPFGRIVGVVDLVDCIGTSSMRGLAMIEKLTSIEEAFGDFSKGRFMLDTADPRHLEKPIPCRGALGLWNVPSEIEVELEPEEQAEA